MLNLATGDRITHAGIGKNLTMIRIDGLAEDVLEARCASRPAAFQGGLLGLKRITPQGQPGPIFFRAGQANGRAPSLLLSVRAVDATDPDGWAVEIRSPAPAG